MVRHSLLYIFILRLSIWECLYNLREHILKSSHVNLYILDDESKLYCFRLYLI